MAFGFKLISADDHVVEPPDLWTERVPKQSWGDNIPHVERQADGTERWLVEGKPTENVTLARVGALLDERYSDPATWQQVPAAAHDPAERLKAMDRDSIEAQVLYPSAGGLGGESLGAIEDPELELACVQAYNDWMLDVWAKASPRFVPQCLVPVNSPDAAVKELQRSVGRGHRGAVLPCAPWRINDASPHLYERVWDPWWAALSETGVPVSFHSGSLPSLMLDVYEGFDPAIGRGFDVVRRPSATGMIVCRFLFSGIGERFPNVKVVFSASGIDWVPFMLEVSDHERERICRKGDLPYEMDESPSEIFHRQCYVTTWFEKVGLRLRGIIGVNNILWHSEFPLETSMWPDSVAAIEKNFEDVPDSDRERILSRNAAELYNISV